MARIRRSISEANLTTPYFGNPLYQDNNRLGIEPEYRWGRMDFSGAYQDSFTAPPSQEPEAFERLTNVQPAAKGILQRRWGYGLWNSTNPAGALTHMYEYQRDTDNTREIVGCSFTGTAPVAFTEAGVLYNSAIYSPSFAGGTPRCVVSRDFAYFVDGVSTSATKWSGSATGGTSAWGIDRGGLTSAGPTNCGTGANDSTAGSVAWTNPGNITAQDTVYATATVNSSSPTQYLKATNFGLAIPATAIIKGITCTWRGHRDVGQPHDVYTYLVRDGSIMSGIYKARIHGTATANGITDFSGSDTDCTYGVSTDLWDPTLTPADLNASTFGFALQIQGFGSNQTFSIDSCRITVYYYAPLVLGATVGGLVTLTNGRVYFYAYRNSSTGHYGDISPASASTGAITAKNQPLTGILASPDSQVDRKVVLATADGGDETTLYLVADLPNATTTLTDNIDEPTLLTRPVLLSTDDFGLEHGVTDNTMPPNGTVPIKYRGRLWLAVGQLLYFSKNIDEVTTNTGNIVGKWEEAWPVDNLIDISEGAETIKGLLTDGDTLYIGTERHIRRLFGDAPPFAKPDILFNETGIITQESWRIVFLEGQPSGCIWMTPDFRVIGSDFNSYEDIGTEIQDVLSTVNPNAVGSVHAMFAASDAYDLYFLALPTGSNTAADTICVYNMRSKAWSVWNLTDQITAMLYNVTAAGVPQFLFAALSGKIYKLSAAYTQDRVNDTPVNVSSTIRTSWLDMDDPTVRKILNELEVITGDPNMTITVEGASTDAEFTTPQTVISNGTLTTGPFGEYKLMLAGRPSRSRYYRLTFSSTGTSTDVLGGFSAEVVPQHRV